MARARAGTGGICCTLEECCWDIWYYYRPDSLPSRSQLSQWKMRDLEHWHLKGCYSRKNPNLDLWGRKYNHIHIELATATITCHYPTCWKCQESAFPTAHNHHKEYYSKTKKSHSCFIGRHRKKKPQIFPALIYLFSSRCHFQTCSVIHCTVNLLVVLQLVHFLTPWALKWIGNLWYRLYLLC